MYIYVLICHGLPQKASLKKETVVQLVKQMHGEEVGLEDICEEYTIVGKGTTLIGAIRRMKLEE